jgi:hypothetical protein
MTPAPERPDLREYDQPDFEDGNDRAICRACGVSVWPENWPNHILGKAHWRKSPPLAAAPVTDAGPVVCVGHCGSLDWTLGEYGVITHKHTCPRRTTTFCQSHRDGCPAAPVTDAGLDVERLRQAIYAISVRYDWEHTTDREDRTEEIAAEYAALSRQAEKETA